MFQIKKRRRIFAFISHILAILEIFKISHKTPFSLRFKIQICLIKSKEKYLTIFIWRSHIVNYVKNTKQQSRCFLENAVDNVPFISIFLDFIKHRPLIIPTKTFSKGVSDIFRKSISEHTCASSLGKDTYFASRASAINPETSGWAADVPVCLSVHPSPRSAVT